MSCLPCFQTTELLCSRKQRTCNRMQQEWFTSLTGWPSVKMQHPTLSLEMFTSLNGSNDAISNKNNNIRQYGKWVFSMKKGIYLPLSALIFFIFRNVLHSLISAMQLMQQEMLMTFDWTFTPPPPPPPLGENKKKKKTCKHMCTQTKC